MSTTPSLTTNQLKIAVVSSTFYGFYEQALLQNAIGYSANSPADILPLIKDAFRHGVSENVFTFDDCRMTVVCVPGALEIPQAVNWLLECKQFDGILTLGCVIKGKTTHFDHVCNESLRGVMKLALKSSTPITSAIITSLTEEDAEERAIFTGKNLGKRAMESLVKIIKTKSALKALEK